MCHVCSATTLPWYGANTADGMMISPYTLPGERYAGASLLAVVLTRGGHPPQA